MTADDIKLVVRDALVSEKLAQSSTFSARNHKDFYNENPLSGEVQTFRCQLRAYSYQIQLQ